MRARLPRVVVATFALGCLLGRQLPAQQPVRGPASATAEGPRLLRATLLDGTVICDTPSWVRDGAGFQLLSDDGRRTALTPDSIRAIWLSAPGAQPMSAQRSSTRLPGAAIGFVIGVPLAIVIATSGSRGGSGEGMPIGQIIGALVLVPTMILAGIVIDRMTEPDPPGWRLLPEYRPPHTADDAKALFAQVTKACQ